MQAHIVHAHPEPRSYNGTLTQRTQETLAEEGYSVSLSDLYGIGFDPVERGELYRNRYDEACFIPLAEQRHAWQKDAIPSDVRGELEHLTKADLLILQFPLWWHGTPAILKGWFDRVFLSGGTYTGRMRYDAGYFKGRRALVSVTTGAPEAAFGPDTRGGDPEQILWPLHYSLHYLGFSVLPPFWTFGVQGHGYSYEGEAALRRRLQENLDSWARRLRGLEGETPQWFPGWNDWDPNGQALQRRQLVRPRGQ